MTYDEIATAAAELERRNGLGLTVAEEDAIRAAVRAVDPRFEYLTSQFQKAPWEPISYRGIVMLRTGKHRFAAPYRDGLVAPFDITDAETTTAKALDAARELRTFWETSL